MKVLATLLLLFITLLSFNQNEKYQIKYYSARDYGKGSEATNRACVQDKNGVLYFGNAGRIIRYNGNTWDYIPVKKENTWIFSLAISDDNKIYVGAQNEFGYLAPDPIGRLTYVSLSDRLPEKEKIFSKIIRIHVDKNSIVFQAEEAIFIYMNGKIHSIFPETSFHISFLVNNEVYVRQREIGLMKLVNNNLQYIIGSDFFKNFGIFSILQSSDKNKLIIVTREDGIWSVNKTDFSSTQIKPSDSEILSRSEIYGATKLNDGIIAINTLSDGLFLTDENFKILTHINKSNGLKVNSVLSLIQDYQDNLWLGLDNGISQINYSSPVTVYDSKDGFSGNIRTINRYNGNLFIGTTNGLFTQQNKSNSLTTDYRPYSGISKEIRSTCHANGSLIIATSDELYEIKNDQLIKVANIEVNSIYYSEKLKALFVAEKNKLVLFQNSGKWNKILEIQNISEEIIRFEEENNNEEAILWMGTSLQGIIRLKFTNTNSYFVDKYYSSEDGLLENTWTIPYKINNKVVFSQKSGLLQFVNEETIKKHLPDSLKDKPNFYRGYFDLYSIDTLKERDKIPFYVIVDSKTKTYVNLNGEIGYFDKLNSLSWITHPFCLTDIGKANVFLPEENGLCWIGGDDGLLLFNENKNKNYSLDFNTILTTVTCTTDSILFSGYGLNRTDSLSNIYVLDYDLNTITFNLTTPFFEGQDKVLYSYTLIGRDTAYSSWQPDSKIVFSNLPEGDYIFKVKAKNIYGHISAERTFSFKILSPWYRTIWAYIIYILLFVFILFTGIRINSQRLIAKNKKLEEIILERTHEINQKNILLEHQKEEILDSINYALRIQKAVLPDNDLTKEWLGAHFIIFKPKDIVSGDFYWTTALHNQIFFCVADCTGHGVPGAFMSMLCISFINEVVLKEEVTESDIILDKLRKMIILSLKQKGLSGEQKDGMDITLCVLNKKTLELQFSGANNPLYIVRDNDKEPIPCDKKIEQNPLSLYEIKADGMPISIYLKMDPFKKHIIQLLKDDRLFLFSDGFADQFGGPNGKKFMYKTFKMALLDTCTFEIDDQKQQLEKRINDWMAHINPDNNKGYNQVDDICVMGVKI